MVRARLAGRRVHALFDADGVEKGVPHELDEDGRVAAGEGPARAERALSASEDAVRKACEGEGRVWAVCPPLCARGKDESAIRKRGAPRMPAMQSQKTSGKQHCDWHASVPAQHRPGWCRMLPYEPYSLLTGSSRSMQAGVISQGRVTREVSRYLAGSHLE